MSLHSTQNNYYKISKRLIDKPSELAPEISKDQDWIGTEGIFSRIKLESNSYFFENWQIKTGSD